MNRIVMSFVLRQHCSPDASESFLLKKNVLVTWQGRGRLLSSRTLVMSVFIMTLTCAARIAVAADDSTVGLREGWKWRTTIPALKQNDKVMTRESRVITWVEKGWLSVRRSTVDGDTEWQVVLARASAPAKPQVRIDNAGGGLEVRYREYFIRDGFAGKLRIYRELKTDESPEWPAISLEGERMPLGGSSCPTASMNSFSFEQWCWISSGLSAKQADLWVRLQPTTTRKGAASRNSAISGFYGTAHGPIEMFYGDSQAQDEGDLFTGTRMNFDQAERGLNGLLLEDALSGKTAPALEGTQWLNGAEPVSLEKLEGRVVVLYFWEDRCKASVNHLAQVEGLYQKFGDRDVVVIGIHSSERSDSAGQSVKDHKITFPVMIDDGQTAKRYRVGAFPNCFLIDPSGKVVWGFGMAPPSDAQIEELLK